MAKRVRGPAGFRCRHCGQYQSIRTAAQVRAMRAHMAEHEREGRDR
jgi:hypothetical protein